MGNEIRCPKCGSNQLSTDKKGYSLVKGAAGAILTGGIGLAAGFIGSNKIKITCLECGKNFNPGEGLLDDELSEDEIDFQSGKTEFTDTITQIKIILIAGICILGFMAIFVW